MSSTDELRLLVEAKSGAPPVQCDADTARVALGYDTAAMQANGYDPSIIAEHEGFNEHLEVFIQHAQFGEYLGSFTPQHGYLASGVTVLPLAEIRREIQELAPGARLFPYGYFPFATSIGGNAVCFHLETGRVVWADHSSFETDEITHKDRTTGEYRSVPFTPEHVEEAVVPLGDNWEMFLSDLLSDRLEKILDELD